MRYMQTEIEWDPFKLELSETEVLKNSWIRESEINSLGYRSDEFQIVKDKTNILFSGCSVTYGDGLFLEEIWANRVWKKIQSVGPFQNLSSAGRSIQTICFETIKFCSKYGNPDLIVLMLPDSQRCVRYDFDQSKHFVYVIEPKRGNLEDQADIKEFLADSFQAYRVLEIFCEMNNIKLMSFSWNTDLEKKFMDFGFKTFNSFDTDSLANLVSEHEKTLSKDQLEFSMYARDGIKGRKGHPGISMHLAWCDIIYNKIKEKYGI